MKLIKRIYGFITSKMFLINLGVAIVVILIIVWFIFNRLSNFVDKDALITVPDFSGYTIDELPAIFKDKGLKYHIDSTHSHEVELGVVIDQKPNIGATVKKGRTIYLIVNALLPELKAVPDLALKSTRRHAESQLISIGFRVTTKYIPYPDQDKVVRLTHNGKELKPGAQLKYGSNIVLEIGKGSSNLRTPLPNLKGLTIQQADNLLSSVSLNVGLIHCATCITAQDSAVVTIIKQDPSYIPNGEVMVGAEIELWLDKQ